MSQLYKNRSKHRRLNSCNSVLHRRFSKAWIRLSMTLKDKLRPSKVSSKILKQHERTYRRSWSPQARRKKLEIHRKRSTASSLWKKTPNYEQNSWLKPKRLTPRSKILRLCSWMLRKRMQGWNKCSSLWSKRRQNTQTIRTLYSTLRNSAKNSRKTTRAALTPTTPNYKSSMI